jgi:sporulation protein YlmC with PRC-barrel domain
MPGQPTFSPLSELLGMPIFDITGTRVGHVIELLVDETDGRIAYVRFGLCRDSSARDREITVPWSAMRTADRHLSGWQVCAGKSTLRSLSKPTPI